MACSGSAGSPCGACKFLRRKCTSNCVFAPYFSNENGAAKFAAIHKVFGASNASKLLLNVPQSADRSEAVLTIAYEAQARLRDPVYGCVAHIFALQHQVAILQAQLMQAKRQVAGMASSRSSMQNQNRVENRVYMSSYMQNVQCMSPLDYCMGYDTEMHPKSDDNIDDMTNSHDLASRMMRD